MKAEALEKPQKITQKIQLVKGVFTPSEASDIIIALIDKKINFHKLKRLQMWEANHASPTEQLDDRILQLKEEKRIAKEFISKMRASGKNLEINSIIDITAAD